MIFTEYSLGLILIGDLPMVKYLVIRIAVIVGIVCMVALLTGNDAAADSYMSGMVGVASSGKDSISETKFINLGFRQPFLLGLSQQVEVGGWVDRAKNGRKGSGYVSWQLGVEAGDTTVARVMVGPALITTPDAYLGGPLEFTEDFYIGIRGRNGNSVGVQYKHFSSGGIYQPNIGRDFLGPQISIPF